jgi:hypothetical protein
LSARKIEKRNMWICIWLGHMSIPAILISAF